MLLTLRIILKKLFLGLYKMAAPLQTVNLLAPGFRGLNTEDSVLSLDPSFATYADNCVIDKYGRISARKGYSVITTSASPLGSSFIQVVKQFRDSGGNTVIFSAGNNKIFRGTTTLTDSTPASYTITANAWKIVNFNDHCYFFQRGYEPLVYSNTLGAVTKMSSHPSYSATVPYANEVLAAYGRLWVADTTSNKTTVYWSDLLNGQKWSGGTSGSIDLTKVWPDGYDEIVALAAHNNLLIIFGKHSIITYQGAEAPATMTLDDTVAGVGCVSRDSVQYTGNDVLFMSYSGLKALGRTIQEKSLPLNDLSRNIKTDIIAAIKAETGQITSVYSPENSFYNVFFPTSNTVYCFDIKGTLEDGSYRVTRWPTNKFKCFERLVDGTLYVGTSAGIASYSGYSDGGATYVMRYYSPNLTFGEPSKLKFLKKIKPTIIGGNSVVVTFKWGYGFNSSFKSFVVNLLNFGDFSPYGIAQYGIDEYSGGIEYVVPNINTSGSGTNIVVGLEATITDQVSLQEFNIYTLLGRNY